MKLNNDRHLRLSLYEFGSSFSGLWFKQNQREHSRCLCSRRQACAFITLDHIQLQEWEKLIEKIEDFVFLERREVQRFKESSDATSLQALISGSVPGDSHCHCNCGVPSSQDFFCKEGNFSPALWLTGGRWPLVCGSSMISLFLWRMNSFSERESRIWLFPISETSLPCDKAN